MADLQELLARNPFPGLRAFSPAESDVFFGRGAQVRDLADKLQQAPLIAVAGDSGCGKSSLVLAGLLKVLEQQGRAEGQTQWRPVVMRPGSAPVDNLAAPLARALSADGKADSSRIGALGGRLRLGGFGLAEAVRTARLPPAVRLLVVVDQFEEIFRFRRLTDADEALAFVKLLLHAAEDRDSPVNVIITLRSNTLGQCADFRDLPEAVSRGQFLVPRLTREQRKQAIVGPVEQRGFRIAPRLVQCVLNDVSDDYDDLPVMQHALSYTWQHWARACQGTREMDLVDYEAAGRADGALSKHANEAFDSLTGLAPVVERIFRALTERLSAGAGEERRPMPLHQLCAVTGASLADVSTVVERYRRPDTAFLLPGVQTDLAANPVIDISHESLIRGWGRLRDWAHDESLSAQTYRRIADAAAEFDAGTGSHLRDPALQFALDWRERRKPGSAWADLYGGRFDAAMAFLDASRAEKLQEEAARDKARKVRVGLAWAVVVISVVSAAVMGVLLLRSQEAERIAEKAVADEKATRIEVAQRNESRRLALEASALQFTRPDTALLLASAALQVQPAAEEAQEIMRRLLMDAPRWMRHPHGGKVTSLSFSPDSRRLLSAGEDGDLALWDVGDGAVIETLDRRLTPRRETPAAIGPDGAVLAAPDADAAALVKLAAAIGKPRLEQLYMPDVDDRLVTTLPRVVSALDAPSGRLAAADAGNDVRLWDLRSGRLLKVLHGAGRETERLALAPGGRWLAAAQPGHGVLLWDTAADHATARVLKGHAVDVRELAFSADGTRLVTAGFDQSVIVWDVARGQPVQRLSPQLAKSAQIERVAIAPGLRRLAVADTDGYVVIWRLDASLLDGQGIRAHDGKVVALAFSPNGSTLVSSGDDAVIAVWDVDEGNPLRQKLRGHTRPVEQLAFSPDGGVLASGDAGGTVMTWDLSPQAVRLGDLVPMLDAAAAVAFSPDGSVLAVASEDSDLYLWDVSRGRRRPMPLSGHDYELTAVAFSADGKRVASGSEDKTVQLWDVDGSTPDGPPLKGHDARVSALAFDPQGRWLASSDRDGDIILWDLARREPRRLPRRHDDEVRSLAFSPDGNTLASGSRDKQVILWDPAGGKPRGQALAVGASVSSLAFSADGLLLATGSGDGQIRFWDPRQGSAQGVPLRHEGLSAIAFDPQGRRLVSGGGGDLRLWDVASRQAIGEPFGSHKGVVWSVSMRADGRTVASAGDDHRVVLWDVDVQHWTRRACGVVGREITPEEWPRGIENTDTRKVCLH